MAHQSNKRFCPYCGGELAPGARKCMHCGEWVTERPAHMDAPGQYDAEMYPADPYGGDIYYDHIDSGRRGRGFGEQPQGFFEAYFVEPFISRFADFGGKSTRKDFWLSTLSLIIVNLAIAGITMVTQTLLSESYMAINTAIWIAAGIFDLSWVSLVVRRMRDAGYPAWWGVALVVPVIGWMLVLLLASMPSKKRSEPRNVRFGGGDFLIVLLCLLLYAGGWVVASIPYGYGERAESADSDSVYSDTLNLFDDREAEPVLPAEETPAAPARVDSVPTVSVESSTPSETNPSDQVPTEVNPAETEQKPAPNPNEW